jgi:hypothetical protein
VLPDTEIEVLICTCYDHPEAWQSLLDAIERQIKKDGDIGHLEILEGPEYEGLTAEQLVALVDVDDEGWPQHTVLFAADDPRRPVLAIGNMPEEGTPPFRITPAYLPGIVANLNIANADFFEYARDGRPDGIHDPNDEQA